MDPSDQVHITARELDILEDLAAGLTGPQIAAKRFIDAETVHTHRTHLYAKLGVHNAVQAVNRARELGLLPRRLAA